MKEIKTTPCFFKFSITFSQLNTQGRRTGLGASDLVVNSAWVPVRAPPLSSCVTLLATWGPGSRAED